MTTIVRVWSNSAVMNVEVGAKATVADLKSIMQSKVPDSVKFQDKPLPAPVLTLKGSELKNDTPLDSLNLSAQDFLVFLYPLVDPEPSRNRPIAQWRRKKQMGVDQKPAPQEPATLESTLDDVLAALSGRPVNVSSNENAAALRYLVEMGFPEARCKKALLLNNMDVEAALGWILDHMEDPTIDEPLTDEQLVQCDKMMRERAVKQQKDSEEAKKQKEKEELEECVALNTCTFAVTGPNMVPITEYFMCYTCGLDNSLGCCAPCATICHAGHVVLKKQFFQGSFFCDCPSAGLCKCCPPEYMPSPEE